MSVYAVNRDKIVISHYAVDGDAPQFVQFENVSEDVGHYDF